MKVGSQYTLGGDLGGGSEFKLLQKAHQLIRTFPEVDLELCCSGGLSRKSFGRRVSCSGLAAPRKFCRRVDQISYMPPKVGQKCVQSAVASSLSSSFFRARVRGCRSDAMAVKFQIRRIGITSLIFSSLKPGFSSMVFLKFAPSISSKG